MARPVSHDKHVPPPPPHSGALLSCTPDYAKYAKAEHKNTTRDLAAKLAPRFKALDIQKARGPPSCGMPSSSDTNESPTDTAKHISTKTAPTARYYAWPWSELLPEGM